jgi:hypothetical protein
MSYGVAPLGRDAIDLVTTHAGLDEAEIAALTARLITP